MEGAFSQASYLKLLNKAIVQNWKLKELFNETFDILKHQCSHPYNKVRHQISVIMVKIMLKSSYMLLSTVCLHSFRPLSYLWILVF